MAIKSEIKQVNCTFQLWHMKIQQRWKILQKLTQYTTANMKTLKKNDTLCLHL